MSGYLYKIVNNTQNQLFQLCTAHTVFSILVTVLLYTVMSEVWRG